MQATEVFTIAIVSSLATYLALHVVGAGIAYMGSSSPPPIKNQALDDAKAILRKMEPWDTQEYNVVIGVGVRSDAALAFLGRNFRNVHYAKYKDCSIACYAGSTVDPDSKEKHVVIVVDAGTQDSDVDTAREKVKEYGGTVADVLALT